MSSDIFGIQNLQSYSPEYNITLQPTSSDISGIHKNNPIIQSIILLSNQHQVICLAYSPESKNSLQKHKPWKMDKLLNTADKLVRIIAQMLYKRIY